MLRKQLLVDSKLSQALQIEDRQRQRSEQLDYDKMWHEISTQTFNEKVS